MLYHYKFFVKVKFSHYMFFVKVRNDFALFFFTSVYIQSLTVTATCSCKPTLST